MCVSVRADGNGVVKVLAEDAQSKGSHVPERAGGDTGCHRAVGVRQSHGAPLQTAGQVCVEPALSGPNRIITLMLVLVCCTCFQCRHVTL